MKTKIKQVTGSKKDKKKKHRELNVFPLSTWNFSAYLSLSFKAFSYFFGRGIGGPWNKTTQFDYAYNRTYDPASWHSFYKMVFIVGQENEAKRKETQ